MMLLNVISVVVTIVLFVVLVVAWLRMKRMVEDAEGFMGVREGDEVPTCEVMRPAAVCPTGIGVMADDAVPTAGQPDAAGDMVAVLGGSSGEDDASAMVDGG